MTTVTAPRLARRSAAGSGSPARLLWELAGAEGRRLLRHPAFLALLGLAVFALGGGAFGEEVADVLDRDDVGVSLYLTLVAWGTLLATNLAALRGRRDRATELYETLPTSAPSRTAAHLLAALAVLPVALALLAAWWVSAELNNPTAAVGTPRLAELAVGPLLILGGGATGVLVARWVPTALAGPVAVVATVVLQSNWGHRHPELRWLHFVAGEPVLDSWLDIRHAGWHLVYLVGLVVLAGTLAVGRHGFPRALTALVAAAVAVVLVAGWVQTRPPTATQVAAVVDRLERPQAHQVCEGRAGVLYCAYPTYRAWIDAWDVPVRGVLARLPAAGRGRELVVRQRLWPSNLADLHPRIRAELDPARVWRADGAVHPGLSWFIKDRVGDNLQLPRAELALGYQAAAWAVGLPPATAWPPRACDAGGQARAVAAMWLAGQATPGAGRALRERAARIERQGAAAMSAPAGFDFVDSYGPTGAVAGLVPEQGSAGRGADVVAAARLLDRPADRVAAALADRWGRLVDPATPSGTLLGELGVAVPAAGTPTGQAPPCPS
jgi:hypothetical protein